MPALVARASQKLSEHGRRNCENWCFQVATTLENWIHIVIAVDRRSGATDSPVVSRSSEKASDNPIYFASMDHGFRGACERPVVSGLDVVSVWIEHECGLVSRRVGSLCRLS